MRHPAAAMVLLSLLAPAEALGQGVEAQRDLVRQITAAGMYMEACPYLRYGPGITERAEKVGVHPRDMRENGRFHAIAVEHAGMLKVTIASAERYSPGSTCSRATELFGPRGASIPNGLVAR